MDDGEGDKKPKTTDEGNQKAPRGRPRKRTAEDETKDENGKKEKKEKKDKEQKKEKKDTKKKSDDTSKQRKLADVFRG